VTSALKFSILYGSALTDFESSVERMALRTTITCDGRFGQSWTISLSDPVDEWSRDVVGNSVLQALTKANKAIEAREAQLAERAPR
jgi:hypothetical protein